MYFKNFLLFKHLLATMPFSGNLNTKNLLFNCLFILVFYVFSYNVYYKNKKKIRIKIMKIYVKISLLSYSVNSLKFTSFWCVSVSFLVQKLWRLLFLDALQFPNYISVNFFMVFFCFSSNPSQHIFLLFCTCVFLMYSTGLGHIFFPDNFSLNIYVISIIFLINYL